MSNNNINLNEGNYIVYIPSDIKGQVNLNEIVTYYNPTKISGSFTAPSIMSDIIKTVGHGSTVKLDGGKSSNKKAKTSKKGGRRRRKTQKSK